jgi:hypothetical protein
MTSEKVMLNAWARAWAVPGLAVAVLLTSVGCASRPDQLDRGPYPQRQVWAVAPLRNESGSLEPDGARLADQLARQLEVIPGVDTLPVNRVLAAMQAMQLPAVTSPSEAQRLRETLGADALVVGSVSDFDPYNPPQLGLAVELYGDDRRPWFQTLDTRQLSSAAVDEMTRPDVAQAPRPVTAVSGFFDGTDPAVREGIQRYAKQRGGHDDRHAYWRQFYLSMDLFTQYVSHQVASRLLQAERQRLAQAGQLRTTEEASD